MDRSKAITPDACQRLVRRLVALSEPRQRVVVLAEEAARLGMEAFADLLAVLVARASERRQEAEQKALTAVMAFLDSDLLGDEDKMALLEAARNAGHAQLLRMLFAPPAHRTADTKKVPDYGAGRPLTLGERKSLARRPSRAVLERVMADPHPAVIRNLMRNPKLTEIDVLRLVSRRPNYQEVLEEIARSPRWNVRYRVKLALARNPYTEPAVALKLLPQLMRQDLEDMLRDRALHPSVLVSCRRLLDGEVSVELSADEDTTVH